MKLNLSLKQKITAAVAGVALAIGGAIGFGTSALAAGGAGGGTGGGPGGSGGYTANGMFFDANLDPNINTSPQQGVGIASMNNVAAMYAAAGGTAINPSLLASGGLMYNACEYALEQATYTATGGVSNDPNQSRVVGMIWAVSNSMPGGSDQTSDNVSFFQSVLNSWINGTDGWAGQGAYAGISQTSGVNGNPSLPVCTTSNADCNPGNMIPQSTEMVNLVNQGITTGESGGLLSVVCIALNNLTQPPPSGYPLSITTSQQWGLTTAGGTHPVSDIVSTSNGGSSISETLDMTIGLCYGTTMGAASQCISKPMNGVPNNGSTTSPTFSPSDFNTGGTAWTTWPAGDYWYDILVPQQGTSQANNLPLGIDGSTDPSESWTSTTTGYTVNVTTSANAPTGNGSTHDTINTTASDGTSEDISAGSTVTLHYTGSAGNQAPSKPVTLNSNTTGQSGPAFNPGDFTTSGTPWTTWQLGTYCYTVQIPQQGNMAAAVNTATTDANECFTLSGYTLTVTTSANAPTGNGSTHDTVNTTASDGTSETIGTGTTVTLHYTPGAGSLATAQAPSKAFTTLTSNTSGQAGPAFSPSDFSTSGTAWTTWQLGTYCYTVQIPQQGNMAAAVNTATTDANECFTITNYNLTVTTSANAPSTHYAGATGGVHDSITTSNGGYSFTETLTGTSSLVYTGPAGNQTPTHPITNLNSNASNQTGPTFNPGDFSTSGTAWTSWPAGQYCFTVSIPLQGNMSAAVNTLPTATGECFTLLQPIPTSTATVNATASNLAKVADTLSDNVSISGGYSGDPFSGSTALYGPYATAALAQTAYNTLSTGGMISCLES